MFSMIFARKVNKPPIIMVYIHTPSSHPISRGLGTLGISTRIPIGIERYIVGPMKMLPPVTTLRTQERVCEIYSGHYIGSHISMESRL
jgi:hypothetical protein